MPFWCCRHTPPTPGFHVMSFFFFNDTATTEIYPLSLHDPLPISDPRAAAGDEGAAAEETHGRASSTTALATASGRSEEHTSELQSRLHLVCRLLLEKKKTDRTAIMRRPAPRVHALIDPPQTDITL